MVFTLTDHKNDAIKCSKQDKQNTFFFMGDVEEYLHLGVLPFCCVMEYFGLIG